MAERSNVWGGSFEINPDDDVELQSSTLFPPPPRDDDDVKRGWLLRPEEDHQNGKRRKKMKKRNRNGMNMNRLVFYTLLVVVILAVFISVLVVVVTRSRRKVSLPPPDNYTDALKKALMFFNAQRSGKLAKDNNVTWRGDSGLNDGKSDFINDLVGGYYDGGDATKYTFPTSFSMAILSWSVLEYSHKYQAVSELKHVKSIIKWGTDYLLKTFNSSGETTDRIVLKVGGDNDRVCWMRPESNDYMRKTESCFECRALAAETAAALAAASIVFKDDYKYSKKLVNGAENVYKFAVDGHGKQNNGASSGHYDSSGHWDEFLWGGTWLYFATGKPTYLSLVTDGTWAKNDPSYRSGPDHSVFSWDHKLPGAMLLLTRLRIFLQYGYPYEELLGSYHQKITDAVCSYLPVFHNFNRTRGGLIQLNHGKPQPLQYVVNAAFLATLFSDYLNTSLTPGIYCAGKLFLNDELQQFARSQIDYILGKNPQEMSYIVGFGEKFPKKVYHRGASIPKNSGNNGCKGLKWKNSANPNPNVIVGAMVAGPNRLDGFQDDRSNYNYTEPTIAGNAGLIAALVALSGENTVTKLDKNTLFYAIPPIYTPDLPPPPPPSILYKVTSEKKKTRD